MSFKDKIEQLRTWTRIRSNNQKIAMLAGMERQVSKLPENDARTILIQARINKLRASIDWTLGIKEEDADGSDDQ